MSMGHGVLYLRTEMTRDGGANGTALGEPCTGYVDMVLTMSSMLDESQTLEVRRTELVRGASQPWIDGVRWRNSISTRGLLQCRFGLKRTEKDQREPVRSRLMLLKWPDAVFICLAAW